MAKKSTKKNWTQVEKYLWQCNYLRKQYANEPAETYKYLVSCNHCKLRRWVTGAQAAMAILKSHKDHDTWVKISKSCIATSGTVVQRDSYKDKSLDEGAGSKRKKGGAFFNSEAETLILFTSVEETYTNAGNDIDEFESKASLINHALTDIKENLKRWCVLEDWVLYRTHEAVYRIALDEKDEEGDPKPTLTTYVLVGSVKVSAPLITFKSIGKEFLKTQMNLRCKDLQ